MWSPIGRKQADFHEYRSFSWPTYTYSGLRQRERKEQENGYNYTAMSFIIFTAYQTLLQLSNQWAGHLARTDKWKRGTKYGRNVRNRSLWKLDKDKKIQLDLENMWWELDSTGSRYGAVARYYEHCNETPSSINIWNFLAIRTTISVSRRTPCQGVGDCTTVIANKVPDDDESLQIQSLRN